MSIEDAAEQMRDDLHDLLAKGQFYKVKFGSLVKKSSRYPVRAQYEYISHTNHNRYFYCCSAYKRSEWDRPHLNYFCIFERPEGAYAMSSFASGRGVLVFPPHFFSRYRERIVKDDSLGRLELIKHFFINNDRFYTEPLTESHTRAYKKYEKEDAIAMAAKIPEGNIFIEARTSGFVMIAKTIISDEMLYEEQESSFETMKDKLEQAKDMRAIFSNPKYL